MFLLGFTFPPIIDIISQKEGGMIRVAIVEGETVYAHQLEDHLTRYANEHELTFAIRLL